MVATTHSGPASTRPASVPQPDAAMSEGFSSLRYRLEGMDCPSCAAKIETALGRLGGIAEVQVNYAAGVLTLKVRDPESRRATIEDKLRGLGFTPHLAVDRHQVDDRHGAGNRRGVDGCCSSQTCSDQAAMAGPSTVGPSTVGHMPAVPSGSWWQSRKARLVLILGAGMAVAFLCGQFIPHAGSWPYAIVAVAGLVPFIRQASRLALSGSPFSIEMLMSVAAVGAIAIGATPEAAVVIFLFALGEWLESLAAQRALAGIRSLIDLVPRTALLLQDGKTLDVPADSLVPGQQVLVRPGDRVPADGEVIDGFSSLDEAPVTGESIPVAKGKGDQVFAGTINTSGALTLRVTSTAQDNMIGRIIHLVEEAQGSRAPMARFIDRFSRVYTPAVLIVAALVILTPPLVFAADWYTWIYRGLALLLIACPCALVLSTPAAIASGLAAGARHGLLIKGGAALETMGRLKTVAFDKTGTLTAGRPVMTDLSALEGEADALLSLAAAVETGASHPIARAIATEAAKRGLRLPEAKDGMAIAGKAVQASVAGQRVTIGSPRYVAESGLLQAEVSSPISTLEAEGKTVVAVIVDDAVLGLIAMRDEARPDAAEAVAALHRLGIRSVMLTGDNDGTAQAIAGSLGLEARGQLLPADKLREISALKADGPVAMIGDGINDAPALAAASVGIAMGGGTDIALETADGAILKNRVLGIAELIGLSRATLRNIRQNIGIALGLKGLFLITSILGTTPLWMAILADTGATVIVTLNALRLLRFRSRW